MYGVRLRRRRRLHEMLDFVELGPHRHKRVSELSGGMQRRAALAAALVHDPTLVFLDEPTAGIDPILRRRFWDQFRVLRDQGRTLVVSTQYIGEAAYCDLVAVLTHGRLLTMDTPDNLRRQAFGGELVDVVTCDPTTAEVVYGLAGLPGVTGPLQRPDMCTVRLVVDSAAEFVPQCLRWIEDHSVAISACQEYVPELDDAFVRLVRADEAATASEEAVNA
jgi:ABC-2 type transport system ATP-binding protein